MSTVEEFDRKVHAADWHDIPRGFYALFIHAIDLDVTLDECAEASYELVGCRYYERKAQRVTKTGRRIGGDSWRGGFAWAEDVDLDRARAYADEERSRWARQFDIYVIADDPEIYQAMYGQWWGRCGCCGRTLTDPDSKMRGIGPECAKALST